MLPTTDPADVVHAVAAGVSRLVSGGLSPEQRERQLDDLANLYAEHTDVRHPLAPLGDTPLRTRAELRAHFANSGGRTAGPVQFEPTNAIVHVTADPELVIFEFNYAVEANGRTFELPCIFVVRVRNGQIVESRDYGDHIGLARTFGRLDDLIDRLHEQDPS